MSIASKMDGGLTALYANYCRVQQDGPVGYVHHAVATGGRVHVSLRYRGDLGAIEALGFETVLRDGERRADGVIDLADLEKIAGHPDVLMLSYGDESFLRLDKSVPDIHGEQVCTRSGAAPNVTFGGLTGEGVFIGIIDSGIDIKHRFMLKTIEPVMTTRIKRIWDMGLGAADGSPPNAADYPGMGYGVEFTEDQINTFLKDGKPELKHKDRDGHGTHVASIAAGSGRDKFTYVGVAPKADLVIVKKYALDNPPMLNNAPVSSDKMTRDAMNYILKTTSKLNPNNTVVINLSAGSTLGPHDGFSDLEDSLTKAFNNAIGKILVTSAGNEANQRQHATITFPASGGTVTVPFNLYDPRTNRTDVSSGQVKTASSLVAVELFYPAAPATVTVKAKLPGGVVSSALAINAPGVVQKPFGRQKYSLYHANFNLVLDGTPGTATRNRIQFVIEPSTSLEHWITDSYALEITSSGAFVAHAWCLQYPEGYGLEIAQSAAPPVAVDERNTINSPAAAANVIAVAAYSAEEAKKEINKYSSRGPLVHYDGSPNVASKPDLAAPGVSIDAAYSRDASNPCKKKVQSMTGTSMAAPHVTGAIALMLQKQPTLSVSDVITFLKDNVQQSPVWTVDPNLIGAGHLDVKLVTDKVPP